MTYIVQFQNLEGPDYHDEEREDEASDEEASLDNMPDGPTHYGGSGRRDDNGPDTEPLNAPIDEVAMMGSQQRETLIDAVERERHGRTCDCSKERQLHCPCSNIYIELSASTSIDTQKAYRAILKRYAKIDKLRKRDSQVHLRVDNEHARETPLTEWGVNAQRALLGMAFPHMSRSATRASSNIADRSSGRRTTSPSGWDGCRG